jgi:hypothetical protein
MLPHLEDCFWLELIQPHIAGGKNQLVFRQILYTYLPFFDIQLHNGPKQVN